MRAPVQYEVIIRLTLIRVEKCFTDITPFHCWIPKTLQAQQCIQWSTEGLISLPEGVWLSVKRALPKKLERVAAVAVPEKF